MTDAIRSPMESRMTREGQQNAGGMRKTDDNNKPYYDEAVREEYPRMMFLPTEVEQTQEHADVIDGLKDKPMVVNRFDGLLCDTIIAHSASEAEVLATNGWDFTARAAHGLEDGLVKATSAKDDEIAALHRKIAEMQAADKGEADAEAVVRRGPGRPPRVRDDEGA